MNQSILVTLITTHSNVIFITVEVLNAENKAITKGANTHSAPMYLT